MNTSRLKKIIYLALSLVCTHLWAQANEQAVKPQPAVTKDFHDARMKWFREARFGMFIHWGVYAVPAGVYQGKDVDGIGEWIMLKAQIPVVDYKCFAQDFTASKYNPEAWAALAKKAGMRYVVMTAKHHDGFALFDSASSDWNAVKSSGAKRDLIAPLEKAVRSEGLRFGLYYSQAQDWINPGGGAWAQKWDVAQEGDFDQYLTQVSVNQVEELLTKFHPDLLWWDTPIGKKTTAQRAAYFAPVLQKFPNLVTNNRLGGGVKGDCETPEQHIPPRGFPGRDFEVCMTINDTWGYKSKDDNWKSVQQILEHLSDISSKGGNFLLNVGPTAEGLIPQASIERLEAVGRWMAVNGEAIHGTQASPFAKRQPWGRVTRKADSHGRGETLFLHIWNWPCNGKLLVPNAAQEEVQASLMSTKAPLETSSQNKDLVVSLPALPTDANISIVVLHLAKPVVDTTPELEVPDAQGLVHLSVFEADAIGNERGNIPLSGTGIEANLGPWTDADWKLDYRFNAPKAQNWMVQGEIATAAPVTLYLNAEKTKVTASVLATGGEQIWKNIDLGTIPLALGEVTFSLSAEKTNWTAIRLRNIILKPVPPQKNLPLATHLDYSWLKHDDHSKLLKKYCYAYWINGWRKHENDKTKDLLCYETGNYGVIFDMASLNKPWFDIFTAESNVMSSFKGGTQRVTTLAPAESIVDGVVVEDPSDECVVPSLTPSELLVEVETEGKKYQLKTCQAGTATKKDRLKTTRNMDGGLVVQHYFIEDIHLFDDENKQLACYGNLAIVGWADSLNFTAELAPEFLNRQGQVRGLLGYGYSNIEKSEKISPLSVGTLEAFSLAVWVKIPFSNYYNGDDGTLLALKGKGFSCAISKGYAFDTSCSLNGEDRKKTYKINSEIKLTAAEWNHLAVTYDGKLLTYYINGAVSGSIKTQEHHKIEIDTIALGDAEDDQKSSSAHYDELRLWSKSLAANEVKEYFSQPQKNIGSTNLVVENSFDDSKDAVANNPHWKDANFSITFKNKNNVWTNKTVIKDWKVGEKKKITLSCNINSDSPKSSDIKIAFAHKDGHEYSVKFDPEVNAYVAQVPELKRNNTLYETLPGSVDDFNLEIYNTSSEIKYIPFQMKTPHPFSAIGVVPLLCYPDGTPTGITIQEASFYDGKKEYLKPYALIPVKPGVTNLLYRLSYKFYGNVAGAYIHQDQVDWGGNQRWIQMVVGGPGEIMTLDADMGSTQQSICDVRGLYFREGLKGNTLRWTEAGWGGDWLIAYDQNKNKLCYNDMKTIISAQGPCFAEILFKGYYGNERSIEVESTVNIVRADDYARVFFELRYKFLKTVSAKDSSFLAMASTIEVPKVAYGNLHGLVKEHLSANYKTEIPPLKNFSVGGSSPWWVSTPESHRVRKVRPDGYSSLIVRSMDSSFGGKSYHFPAFSLMHQSTSGNQLHAHIVAPEEIKEFMAGDRVHLNVEWIMLPRIADDYFGPNQTFRKHLEENPKSWQTVYREAKGNHLKVKASGGSIIKNYPLIIKAESTHEIQLEIEGGVGYVPVRFEGLATDRGYTLHQIINNTEVALDQSSPLGNDFWQTDFDVPSKSYKRSYNICLDETPISKWVLRYKKP